MPSFKIAVPSFGAAYAVVPPFKIAVPLFGAAYAVEPSFKIVVPLFGAKSLNFNPGLTALIIFQHTHRHFAALKLNPNESNHPVNDYIKLLITDLGVKHMIF